MPHYHLMQQVHMDHIPEAEHDWGPAPGKHAYTPGMLAKLRTLNPMFWRCAIRFQGEELESDSILAAPPQPRPAAALPP